LILKTEWKQMLTFHRSLVEHWRHLGTRTSRLYDAAVRLRTNAAKRYKTVSNTTALIPEVLLVAQTKFCKFNAPKFLGEVYTGAKCVDIIRVTSEPTRIAT
jgi:hypothetical protein